jgi:hypothetical protein
MMAVIGVHCYLLSWQPRGKTGATLFARCLSRRPPRYPPGYPEQLRKPIFLTKLLKLLAVPREVGRYSYYSKLGAQTSLSAVTELKGGFTTVTNASDPTGVQREGCLSHP